MSNQPDSGATKRPPDGDRYDPLDAPTTGQAPPDYSIPGDVIWPERGPDGAECLRVRTHRNRQDWVPPSSDGHGPFEGRAPATIEYRGRFYEVLLTKECGSVFEYLLAP